MSIENNNTENDIFIDINNIQNIIDTKIDVLLNNISIGDEFEASFKTKDYKITLEKYIILVKYLMKKSQENNMKLEEENYLNVSYNYDYQDFNNYRLTVTGAKNINDKLLNIYQRENHIIF